MSRLAQVMAFAAIVGSLIDGSLCGLASAGLIPITPIPAWFGAILFLNSATLFYGIGFRRWRA